MTTPVAGENARLVVGSAARTTATGSHAALPSPGRAGAATASWRISGPPALALLLLLLLVAGRYGPHWDELYFAQLPLRWWYEDQPPLTVWLTWLTGQLGDDLWLQRLPAVAAAAAGPVVAAEFSRSLGHSARAQRWAAWASGFAVFPLAVGHVFITATLDLLAWQVILLMVLKANLGDRRWLVWAGLVAGLACWNKLLVLILVMAVVVALVATAPRVLATRHAVAAGLVLGALAAPQVIVQVLHGLPMSEVSSNLVDRHGGLVRWLLIPALTVFLGPPLVPICWRGLVRPWTTRTIRAARFLLPTAVLVLVWTFCFPSQPYYPVGAFLPALAMGFGFAGARVRWSRRRTTGVIAANAVVATVVCLPVLPARPPWQPLVARINPVTQDQIGWPDRVAQLAQAGAGPGVPVVTDQYSLAGAVHRYGPTSGITEVFSGTNALWPLGPPESNTVLLVGELKNHRNDFQRCHDAGTLTRVQATPSRLDGTPMMLCQNPIGGWEHLWPRFRQLGD